MILAEYRGMDDVPLESGKVYEISTVCTGGRLVVSVKGVKKSYSNLEQVLKEWKVRGVYHGQSRNQKSKTRRGKEGKEV